MELEEDEEERRKRDAERQEVETRRRIEARMKAMQELEKKSRRDSIEKSKAI